MVRSVLLLRAVAPSLLQRSPGLERSTLTLACPAAPATHEEMRAARLPISFRDGCAGLLIPLNKCRQANMYMPFRCGHERHEYEKWCVQHAVPALVASCNTLPNSRTRPCSPPLFSMYIEHLKQVKAKLDGQ